MPQNLANHERLRGLFDRYSDARAAHEARTVLGFILEDLFQYEEIPQETGEIVLQRFERQVLLAEAKAEAAA